MKKVLFISSAGGHLTELLQLEPIFSNYDYRIVTELIPTTKYLKEAYKGKISFLVFGSKDHTLVYPFKFTFNFFKSLWLFFRFVPDCVVSTGTHTAVPLLYIAKAFGKKVVFIESFADIEKCGLAGKMIYPIADLFIVQWEQLQKKLPKSVYGGWIF